MLRLMSALCVYNTMATTIPATQLGAFLTYQLAWVRGTWRRVDITAPRSTSVTGLVHLPNPAAAQSQSQSHSSYKLTTGFLSYLPHTTPHQRFLRHSKDSTALASRSTPSITATQSHSLQPAAQHKHTQTTPPPWLQQLAIPTPLCTQMMWMLRRAQLKQCMKATAV